MGKIKESFYREAIEEYKKRLSKYTSLEIIEVEDEKTNDYEIAIRKEKEKIEKYINPKDFIISLAIEGKEMNSLEFASKLENTFISYSNITFIIGGSLGLTDKLLNLCNLKICFSRMTFPHQLIRIFLLEQIFRSFKIQNNETYHR